MADPDLVEVKGGWFATAANARRAAFGRTQEEAAAAWETSEARFRAALARYRLMERGNVPTLEHEPGETRREERAETAHGLDTADEPVS
jgi:hypothetical protein